MKTMKSKFFACLCATLSVLMISSADLVHAQGLPGAAQQQPVKEDFTDEELKTFIQANKSVVQVQQAAEQKMMQAIEETDMDVNRFNEIATAQQDPQADAEASAEEMATFNEAAQKVMAVQRETQSEIAAAVEEEGMEFNEYRQIMMAYQNSPKVQEQITKLIEEEQSQN
ncbi:TRAP-type mannitol/chloroaromatic compound transport system substrate-binding protein [Catalinimonas alkaloidigena]|nr:TRAP-type mannitol/chloroaromatic compound transport system substrate-binding protein [Catalinimonas alkaloidigena]